MSLGVALVNFKVAELFCSNRFGDAAVDMGFEHGFVVDYATGWDMEDEEQMQEVGDVSWRKNPCCSLVLPCAVSVTS